MNAKYSKNRSKTDWSKVKVQSDSDIDTSEILTLDADFFKSAILRMPSKKVSITVRLDSVVLELAEARQPFERMLSTVDVADAVLFSISSGLGVIAGSVIDFDQTIIRAYG